MRDIIISAVVAVLILCLAVFFFLEKKENSDIEKNVYESELKTSDLRAEKKTLEQELDMLNNNHKKDTLGASRIMLVFNDIDSYFVSEICPMLEVRGIVGVITLNKDNLPSDSSVLSESAFERLVEKGWETAVYYDGFTQVLLWYTEQSTAFLNSNIDMPTTVVVSESVYTDELYSELYALGFTDIIIKTHQPDISKIPQLGTAAITDSVGWYTTNAAGIITLFSSRTGDIAFTVGGESPDEKYESEQFEKMLDTISHSVQKELVFYTTPSVSREYKKKLSENQALLSDSYYKRKAELEEEIERLEKEIVEIYDEYVEEK